MISVFCAVIMVLLLAACGGKSADTDVNGVTDNNSGDSKAITAEQTEKGVKITETAARSVQTEVYETADFSITIPKGWAVTSGGANISQHTRV